jgi:hypothetical protein
MVRAALGDMRNNAPIFLAHAINLLINKRNFVMPPPVAAGSER